MQARMNDILSGNFRNRIVGIYGFLVAVNIGAWVWAIIAFHDKPVLLGTAVLAYTFGLRHAVDADHIAAIDNVTRKLMQDGRRPVSVGFYLAIGHSTIVVIAALVAYWTASAAEKHFVFLKDIGGIVSTGCDGAPRAFYCWNDSGRHYGRSFDDWGIWMGVFETDS